LGATFARTNRYAWAGIHHEYRRLGRFVMEEEKSVLRWGGLAGILGGIIFILVFIIVIVFVGPDPTEPEAEVMRFPDIRAAHTRG
jgi:hypothetical protein